MITPVYVWRTDEKAEYFNDNCSAQDLWVVAHLPAKKELHEKLLSGATVIFSKSIQRASDYWQWLFSVNCPDWRIVSESLMYALIEEWFSESKVRGRFRDSEMFFNFFSQCLPLLAQEQNELIEDWIEANPERARLTGWFEQAQKFWSMLKDKKWVARPWVLSILQNKDDIYFGDYSRVFVDLGINLKQEEVNLLLRLGETKDVTVFVPHTSWSHEFERSLSVYNKLIGGTKKPKRDLEQSAPTGLTLGEFPSVLKECKNAISTVRSWLEAGISARRIGILSSNIEDYWDMVREHLIVEGVPVKKNYVARAIALPAMQICLARLRLAATKAAGGTADISHNISHGPSRDLLTNGGSIASGDESVHFQQADLEMCLYNTYSPQPAYGDYQKFKKNYSYMYDNGAACAEFFPEQTKESLLEGKLSFFQFVQMVEVNWPAEDKTALADVIDTMTQELSAADLFSFPLWMRYLELIISRHEFKLIAENEAGVYVGNFADADWSELSHFVVLGCEQSRLRESLKSPFTMEDIWAVEADLGYFMERNESSKKEFSLRWLVDSNPVDARLTHSLTDFTGQPQIAASFWLGLETNHLKVTHCEPTRWDQLMGADFPRLGSELDWQPEDFFVHEQKFKLESDLSGYEKVGMPRRPSLSASGISKLFDCGFKFYAEKVLSLTEPQAYDLEIDPAFQGTLLHQMVDEIVKRYRELTVDRPTIEALYDELSEADALSSQGAPFPTFWRREKYRHVSMLMKFLDLEKNWKNFSPETAIVASEVDFKGYVGIADERLVFSRENKPDFLEFRGRIDRIDRDAHGNLAILDYKTSSGHVKGMQSWVEKGQFQMPLYVAAVEAGLCENVPPAPVVSAGYIFLKEAKRGSGYILSDTIHGFDEPPPARSRQGVSGEKKDQLFADVFHQVKTLIEKLNTGHLSATPADEKNCNHCRWRVLCRSPHLR